MFAQYLHHIVSDKVLLFCCSAMVLLFLLDCASLFGRRWGWMRKNLSFGATIVSTGLFATFVGVLLGLYGFDSRNISESVPRLLEGLRFAFAASCLGMFFALTLSILRKLFGHETEDGALLQSIDRKMGQLVSTFESPGELVRQFTEMKGFLRQHLETINSSLERAIGQLARGATQEVVEALQRIITDFNNNLTEQFGENFKELNVACSRLVEWQKRYKTHVEVTESSLKTIIVSLDESCRMMEKLHEGSEKTQKTCRDVSSLIKTYDVQIKSLEAHLKSCKDLGDQAKEFLTKTQSALISSSENMTKFSSTIENSVNKQSQSLTALTTEIEKKLPESLGELEKVLTGLTTQFASDYRSLFQFITDRR